GDNCGTGFIEKVKFGKDNQSNRIVCACENCKSSANPKYIVGKIYVRTAYHILPENTPFYPTNVKCQLFYENENSPVVHIECSRLKNRNMSSDTVCLVCKSCDLHLCETLDSYVDNYKEVKLTVNIRHSSKRDTCVIIVSHKHGEPQHVTVGPFTRKHIEAMKNMTSTLQYWYKADTCGGSSGANVFYLGGVVESGFCIHKGTFEESPNMPINVGNFYKDWDEIEPFIFFDFS
ncbi:hypothetical protein BgiMline_021793, partial [Biomphalaria glabrata]